ncbi:MAG: glycosyltransferase family 4 protein [Dehalococcoidia bacterium]
MNILQVTAHYPPFLGGIANHVHQVSERLVQRGARVTVLTTDPSGTLPAHEEQAGVEVRRIRSWPRREDFFFAPGIARPILEGPWDLVHVQGSHTLVPPVAMAAARRAALPYVVTFHTGVHSSGLRNLLRPLEWRLLRPLFNGAARFVGVSTYEARYFQQALGADPSRFVVIPNGADLPLPPTDAPRQSTGKTTIVSIGRLERFKGHHRAIEAMPAILATIPDARLLILGSGPFEPDLHRIAAEQGVADRVEIRFIPPAERETLAGVLRDSALITLLSEGESHPLAVIEAAALGCSILVGEDGMGCSELAERGLARSIALSSTPEQVAAAVVAQIANPFQPGEVEIPTWDACADKLFALYAEIVKVPACVS